MRTESTLRLLRRYESRNILHVEPDGSWPIVWERARGVNVWDAEGRKYLDLTAAFGVMAAGHANPRVVRAGQRQMARLLHAMGDVHPHALKAELARELSRITFERWLSLNRQSPIANRQFTNRQFTNRQFTNRQFTNRQSANRQSATRQSANRQSAKTIFCNSGFEAVEAALKTALLATGRRGVIAFEGGYHGVGYGSLNATHRDHFRAPFREQLGQFGHFVPFPDSPGDLARLEKALRAPFAQNRIGAILVEPVQGRAGIRVPPLGFLPFLRAWCDRHKTLLVLDEIYTGLGRTGRWFACEHSGVVPDIICLGKALAGGFPLSACVGRADLMDTAWPESSGEAIHTSTFLGHPVGCAMALAQIEELRRRRLVERSARLGCYLLKELQFEISNVRFQIRARGLGLMAGVELELSDGTPATSETSTVVKRLLRRGFIVLPEGEHGNVISFTPPLTISEAQIRSAVRALRDELRRLT